MKAVKVTIGGGEYHLLFNGAAMFEVEERFGGSTPMLDAINQPGSKGFGALCGAVCLLAGQGELARRYLGYEAGGMPDEEGIRALASPADVAELKQAVIRAVTLGYGREVEGGDVVDLGLAELNQKKRKR